MYSTVLCVCQSKHGVKFQRPWTCCFTQLYIINPLRGTVCEMKLIMAVTTLKVYCNGSVTFHVSCLDV